VTASARSEHEGKVVDAGRYRFRILNGVRIWQTPVPFETMRDIVLDPYGGKG
jgi:hypothetical protein